MWSTLIILIVFASVISIIKMGLRHAENIERIKHGYPTLDDKAPMDLRHKSHGESGHDERLQ
ncbi:MAG: hypothetical protein LBT44_06025 [Clostridiales bacterium]|nr:hypothetical protein [Clostridiales bacterium]